MAEFVTNLVGRKVGAGRLVGIVVGAIWGTLLVELGNGQLTSWAMGSVVMLPDSAVPTSPVAAPAAAPAVSATGTGPGTRFVGG